MLENFGPKEVDGLVDKATAVKCFASGATSNRFLWGIHGAPPHNV